MCSALVHQIGAKTHGLKTAVTKLNMLLYYQEWQVRLKRYTSSGVPEI